MSNWHVRYLDLAKNIAEWSKDPSTKIGAITVGDKDQILSQGYNGFPRGIEDTLDRLNDREVKYDFIVHGEMNCIYNACLNGVSLNGSTLYVFGLPICSLCANGIIQVGIKSVIMAHPHDLPDRWKEAWPKTRVKFNEAKVDYARYEFDTRRNWLDTKGLVECARFERNGKGGFYRTFSWPESKHERHEEEPYIRPAGMLGAGTWTTELLLHERRK